MTLHITNLLQCEWRTGHRSDTCCFMVWKFKLCTYVYIYVHIYTVCCLKF